MKINWITNKQIVKVLSAHISFSEQAVLKQASFALNLITFNVIKSKT